MSFDEQVVNVMTALAQVFLFIQQERCSKQNFIIQHILYISAVSMGTVKWQLVTPHDRYTSYLPTYPRTFSSSHVPTKMPLTMEHEHALKGIPISSVKL